MAPSASVEMLVIFLGSPMTTPEAESKSATHTCEPPPLELMKRNFLPSGDQCPPFSPAGSKVIWRESPPANGTTQRCEVRLLAARSTSTAANSTHLPSGETAGPPMRLSAIMSSKVKGRLASVGDEELWPNPATMLTMI